jgi:hypothetical protein
MKTIRVIAVLSVVAASAWASKFEQATEVSASAGPAAHDAIAALHAAIPASATSGNVFEYSSQFSMPAEPKIAFAGVVNGNVFEYY